VNGLKCIGVWSSNFSLWVSHTFTTLISNFFILNREIVTKNDTRFVNTGACYKLFATYRTALTAPCLQSMLERSSILSVINGSLVVGLFDILKYWKCEILKKIDSLRSDVGQTNIRSKFIIIKHWYWDLCLEFFFIETGLDIKYVRTTDVYIHMP